MQLVNLVSNSLKSGENRKLKTCFKDQVNLSLFIFMFSSFINKTRKF